MNQKRRKIALICASVLLLCSSAGAYFAPKKTQASVVPLSTTLTVASAAVVVTDNIPDAIVPLIQQPVSPTKFQFLTVTGIAEVECSSGTAQRTVKCTLALPEQTKPDSLTLVWDEQGMLSSEATVELGFPLRNFFKAYLGATKVNKEAIEAGLGFSSCATTEPVVAE